MRQGQHVFETKVHISEAGRILIPSSMRKALNLEAGDEVLLRVEDQQMHIIPLFKAVKEAQDIIKQYNTGHLKLTQVLSKLRKEDMRSE